MSPDKKEICTLRAFGKMTSDFDEVKFVVIRYLSSLARKLGAQNSYARRIYVGIETNSFNEYLRQIYRDLQIEFCAHGQHFRDDPIRHVDTQSDMACIRSGRETFYLQPGDRDPYRPHWLDIFS